MNVLRWWIIAATYHRFDEGVIEESHCIIDASTGSKS